MADDDKKIGWMYEGTKAIVNREDYLLGKKIDKNFELYSDVFVKDKEDDRAKQIEQRMQKPCNEQASTSKVSCLQLDVVRAEDPLVALKVREEQRRREFIENPLNKLKYEKMMRKAFEEMKKAVEEGEKKKPKKHKKKKKDKRDSSLSDDDDEKNTKSDRRRGRDSKNEFSEKRRKSRRTSTSPEKSEKERSDSPKSPVARKRTRHDSESSASSDEQRERNVSNKRKGRDSSPTVRRSISPHKRQDLSSSSNSAFHRENLHLQRTVQSKENNGQQRKRGTLEIRRSPSPKRQYARRSRSRSLKRRSRSRSVSPKHRRQQRCRSRSISPKRSTHKRSTSPKRRHESHTSDQSRIHRRRSRSVERRRRSRSPGRRRHDEKKAESGRKVKLSEAEKEAKRLEMMSNAKWRDDLRTKNVSTAAKDDQKELDDEKGKVANFIKPLVNAATDSMSIEDKIKVKRKQLQSSHGYMDKL